VKLLFDQNLSPILVKLLADLYPDSNHVYKLGIDRNSDEELRDYARRKNFVIVTKDSDFSDLCILHGFPPKVIWVRRGNCSTSAIERIASIRFHIGLDNWTAAAGVDQKRPALAHRRCRTVGGASRDSAC
jgi:predicted nuclease of predicted toxin-antitoxin system